MDKRDTHRRSCSPRRRHRKRSFSHSCNSLSSSDTNSHFSQRNRRSRCHNSQKRSRSRSPSHDHRRHHARPSSSSYSQDNTLRDDTSSMNQRAKHQREEHKDRKPRGSGHAKASEKCRRIAPNAFALQSIVLGTARSRDRMDERERARAKKKLEDLNATANTL